MTVNDIFDYLNSLYPVNTACDFDNPGILVGDKHAEVKRSVISLDCTDSAIDKAVKNKCQLIITHHPVIFEPLKKVLSDSPVYRLIKNGISVISMHTNLDIGENGVNDTLCDVLELNNTEKYIADDGFPLNTAFLPYQMSPEQLAGYIKKKLGGRIKYSSGSDKINRVLVCSGSGGSYFTELIRSGCDALITADVKHNVFIDAARLGKSVFDAGHFETEDVVINRLNNILSSRFNGITFFTDHTSEIKYE